MFQTEQRLRGKQLQSIQFLEGGPASTRAIAQDVQGSPDFEGPWAKQPEPQLPPIKWGPQILPTSPGCYKDQNEKTLPTKHLA